MKSLLRYTVFNAIALYITNLLLEGMVVEGGLETYFVAGFILSILFKLVKPVLNLVSLPLNMVSLGLFSFFINTILLYILTVFMPNITISAFTFYGTSFAGFVIPDFSLSSFWAFVFAAGALSITVNFLNWVIKR